MKVKEYKKEILLKILAEVFKDRPRHKSDIKNILNLPLSKCFIFFNSTLGQEYWQDILYNENKYKKTTNERKI